jgi:hypothetical protein
LLKVSGVNDLYRLYLSTTDDDVEFHYVCLPAGYVRTTEKQFNKEEMNRQFELGYRLGLEGALGRRCRPDTRCRTRSS